MRLSFKTLLSLCLFCAVFILFSIVGYSQIKSPKTPEVQNFSPIQIEAYYRNSNSYSNPPAASSGESTYPMGSHANGVIQQQNAAAMRQMGYRAPVVPPTDPTLQHEFIINQYKNQQNQETQFVQEAIDELNEVRSNEAAKSRNYFATDKFKAETKDYLKAKSLLDDMLTGKIPLSLKDAFYILENAYGGTHLSYADYTSILKKSSDFIKQWLHENGLNASDNEALHRGIQAFMKDTLVVSGLIKEPSSLAKTMHLPFYYDYVDFRAEEDFRNYFVTKTFATGSGQCNSLPTAYLLLAEQLGAKAYLSYAPLHSFVKFPDDEGKIHNYEATSHYEISDQWYVQHLGVTRRAVQSKIYLDTLNNKQIVAGAMMDLAFGYLRKHGVADGVFINECVNDALQYFPNADANVQGWLLRSSLLAAKLHRTLERDGIRDLKDIQKSPEASQVYNHWLAVEQKLKDLGYQELPTSMYEELMQQQDSKAVQQKQSIDTKTKRDLFHTFK